MRPGSRTAAFENRILQSLAAIFVPQRLAATLLNTADPIDVKFHDRQNDTTIAM